MLLNQQIKIESDMKKILVLTGGGDCPGLNAVIRGIVKAANEVEGYEVWGSIEAFNGIMKEPAEVVRLTAENTAGIHVKGGTIIKTTNRGNPFEYPVQQEDGTWITVDRTQMMVDKIRSEGFDAVVNIGGDGSQTISQGLFEKGLNIVGVPKTIDKDLSGTDLTFGFTTAVQIATESFDRLVTTAESHHRVMIMEVMGRDAGWIALHTAIAGGAEICLIPEIPFKWDAILEQINKRYQGGQGFVNIVVAEGAKPEGGEVIGKDAKEDGDYNIKLGGVANYLRAELEKRGCEPQIRTTILGHTQRGGIPVAFDRILASAMGVKAFDLVEAGDFGKMVSFRNNEMTSVWLKDAISRYHSIGQDHYLLGAARKLGIAFGD